MATYIPQAVLIKKIVQENALVRSYILDYSVGGRPGQFVNVWIPGVSENPMSIADDDGKNLMLTIANVGDFSHAMTEKKVGDRIGIRGPYGKGFHWKARQHLIMVAGGYGAAPLYFVSKLAVQEGCSVDFFIGARNKDLLLYLDRLDDLSKKLLEKGTSTRKVRIVAEKSALRVFVATDDGSQGHRGYNVEILEQLLNQGAKPDWVFTCGPEMMMKRVSDICWERKISAQISVERYMKCGFGVCGQCCVDDSGEPVCMQGPVMENEKVRQISEFGKYHRDSEGRKVYW